MADELVPLCQCWDVVEAHTIRASLEARGIEVLIEGEHHRGIMGIAAAAVKLRVLVPASQLELARELASDLIPDLAGEPNDEGPDLGEGLSPARRPPAEDLVDYLDEGEAAEPYEPTGPRKKSLAVAAVISCMGLAIGTLHMYAGQERFGGALFLIACAGIGSLVAGQPIGGLLLVAVWLVDIIHGFILLSRYNAAIEQSSK